MMSKLRSAISHLIKSEGHGSRKSNSATDCDDLMANSIPYRLLLVNAANHRKIGFSVILGLNSNCNNQPKPETVYALHAPGINFVPGVA